MKNGETHGTPEKGTAKEQLNRLVEDVTAEGKAWIAEGVETAKEAWTENKEKIREKATQWGVDEALEDVQTYVKKKPLKSLLIAAGVGAVVAMLLKSGSSDNE